jgi:hypothetical protein
MLVFNILLLKGCPKLINVMFIPDSEPTTKAPTSLVFIFTHTYVNT